MKEIKPEDSVCMNCMHGVFDTKAGQVICHRFPPMPVLMQVPNPNAVQAPNQPSHVLVNQALPPTVNPDWWCAEFRRKAS